MRAHSALTSTWLLVRFRLRRLANQLVAAGNRKFNRLKPKAALKPGASAAASRSATPTKRSTSIVTLLFLTAAMLFSFGNIARTSILSLYCKLDSAGACFTELASPVSGKALALAADHIHDTPFADAFSIGMTMQLTILFVVAVVLPMGTREISAPDWDLEWLVTLPMSRLTMLTGRIMERTVTNLGGILALLPMCTLIAWYRGDRWYALPVALGPVLLLLLLAATVRTVIDTGLRLALAPSSLRNLQAAISILGLISLYFAMSFGVPSGGAFQFEWASQFPAWTMLTPPGLVVLILGKQDLFAALIPLASLVMEVGIFCLASLWGLQYLLRGGVVGAGARESGRRHVYKAETGHGHFTFGTVVQRRELRLLGRDRNFLLQTLMMPVVIVGSQLIFNGGLHSVTGLGENPKHLAAVAFGLGAYMLMLSCFQTLNNEGGSLWLLYTFPKSIRQVLKEKAILWGCISILYALIAFSAGWYFSAAANWQFASLLIIVLIGMPIYSLLAVSLGVFACNPFALEVQSKIRQDYVMVYMLVTGFYIYAMYTDLWSQKVAVLVLAVALAIAMWQKACDHLPFLLDPVAAPPEMVSTADGLIAAQMFFVLQGVVALFFRDDAHTVSLPGAVVGFVSAGAITYAAFRYTYWRGKTQGVPAIFRGANIAAAKWGMGLGTLAAACGLAYLFTLQHFQLLPADQVSAGGHSSHIWLLVLCVVAAPIFEEFIFRGLIFGGMQRTMHTGLAIAVSAAIFACVHPPMSMLPVFILGLCTAIAYHRTKALVAPMVVHAIYNAVVVGAQLLVLTS